MLGAERRRRGTKGQWAASLPCSESTDDLPLGTAVRAHSGELYWAPEGSSKQRAFPGGRCHQDPLLCRNGNRAVLGQGSEGSVSTAIRQGSARLTHQQVVCPESRAGAKEAPTGRGGKGKEALRSREGGQSTKGAVRGDWPGPPSLPASRPQTHSARAEPRRMQAGRQQREGRESPAWLCSKTQQLAGQAVRGPGLGRYREGRAPPPQEHSLLQGPGSPPRQQGHCVFSLLFRAEGLGGESIRNEQFCRRDQHQTNRPKSRTLS